MPVHVYEFVHGPPENVPLPEGTANVTDAPDTAMPPWSRTDVVISREPPSTMADGGFDTARMNLFVGALMLWSDQKFQIVPEATE
jgi:hypothetical protein